MNIVINGACPVPRREITHSEVPSGVYIVQEGSVGRLRVAIKCGNRVTFLNDRGPSYDTIPPTGEREHYIVREVEEVTVR
jgi:hypothetical protein